MDILAGVTTIFAARQEAAQQTLVMEHGISVQHKLSAGPRGRAQTTARRKRRPGANDKAA